ncbi:uncharacterized protein EV422DRAFT_513211 [Fimicolochytrium jonesii]|uniref:uncharacterized protein n=1 Tax=Fimicolochytrium jonesii TaxID=1396493 RepID=UPI0022FEEA5B|nr:uncharacterized protein EV422DRAFT_513211 [Fimicolochytrium jonesii]KAI8827255.1 hypothetical protein EV422DRAFT_513211 [Fimicolochytrium jonesii]
MSAPARKHTSPIPDAQPPEPPPQPAAQQPCTVCQNNARFMCPHCGPACRYCSHACQARDWELHKAVCLGNVNGKRGGSAGRSSSVVAAAAAAAAGTATTNVLHSTVVVPIETTAVAGTPSASDATASATAPPPMTRSTGSLRERHGARRRRQVRGRGNAAQVINSDSTYVFVGWERKRVERMLEGGRGIAMPWICSRESERSERRAERYFAHCGS